MANFIQTKRVDPLTKQSIDGTKSQQKLIFEISDKFKLKSAKLFVTLNVTSAATSTASNLYKQGAFAFFDNIKIFLGGAEIFNMNEVDRYYASLVDLMKIDSLTATGWNQWIGSNLALVTGGATGSYDLILPLKDIPVFDKDFVLDSSKFSNGFRVEFTFKQFQNNLYADVAPTAVTLDDTFIMYDAYDRAEAPPYFILNIKRIDVQTNSITSASSTINLSANYSRVSKIWFSQLTTANLDDGTKTDQYDSKSSNITDYQFKIQNKLYPETKPNKLSLMRFYAQDLYEYKNSEKVFYYRGSDINDFTNNSFVGGFYFSKYGDKNKYRNFTGTNNTLTLTYSTAPAVTLFIFTVYNAKVVVRGNKVENVIV